MNGSDVIKTAPLGLLLSATFFAEEHNEKLADLNPKAFWSEIKNMNNCKTPLPTSIEGVSGGVQIVEFCEHIFVNY